MTNEALPETSEDAGRASLVTIFSCPASGGAVAVTE